MELPSLMRVPGRRSDAAYPLLRQCMIQFRRFARVFIIGFVVFFVTSALSGCGSRLGWPSPRTASDFQRAEELQQRTGKPLLLVYLDSRAARDKAMKDCLKEPEVRARLNDFLECRLAQYDVERAPSLVLVHADGTYQSYTETPTPESVHRFLVESRAPGERPSKNPLIARAPRYAWGNNLEAALRLGAESRREVLLVCHRGATRDWSRLEAMLSQPEVFRRFDGMLHVRITGWGGTPSEAMRRFGVNELPALVILHADGSFDRMELPMSSEAIIRFADSARGQQPSDAVAGALSASTP
jgi:hypothetical protein